MKRKSYDRWGVEITSFNRNIAFYVECDCGELAKNVYQKKYFDCPACHRKYKMKLGQYVEIPKEKSINDNWG